MAAGKGSIMLSNVLEQFNASLKKTAEEVPGQVPNAQQYAEPEAQSPEAAPAEEPQAPEMTPEELEELEAQAAAEEEAAAGEAPPEVPTEDALVAAAHAVSATKAQATAAVENLKAIAKTAQAREMSALEKEASEFGHIFAHTVASDLAEQSNIVELTNNAYTATMNKIAEENNEVQEAYDNMVKEAYELTMQKVAAAEEEEMAQLLDGISKEAFDLTVEKIAGDEGPSLEDIYTEAYLLTKEALED